MFIRVTYKVENELNTVWICIGQPFLYGLNFEMKPNEWEDKALEILHQIIEAAQALWVFRSVYIH